MGLNFSILEQIIEAEIFVADPFGNVKCKICGIKPDNLSYDERIDHALGHIRRILRKYIESFDL